MGLVTADYEELDPEAVKDKSSGKSGSGSRSSPSSRTVFRV